LLRTKLRVLPGTSAAGATEENVSAITVAATWNRTRPLSEHEISPVPPPRFVMFPPPRESSDPRTGI
jgi:hypothetical protein